MTYQSPTRHLFALLICLWLVPTAWLPSAELELLSPSDYQVVQRTASGNGIVEIRGRLSEDAPGNAQLEVRLSDPGSDAAWKSVEARFSGREFESKLDTQSGGWRRLEVRVASGGSEIARATVEHVGIGEVFLIAGQSNSANHGEEKQTPKTNRVVAFDGQSWKVANDPQPGASGKNGSFIPAFGDQLVDELDVPVGIVACGIGATSVREWLPKGSQFPNPPTLVGRVEQTSSGQWVSKGEAFDMLVQRMKSLGTHGFRAALWHQGKAMQIKRTRLALCRGTCIAPIWSRS